MLWVKTWLLWSYIFLQMVWGSVQNQSRVQYLQFPLPYIFQLLELLYKFLLTLLSKHHANLSFMKFMARKMLLCPIVITSHSTYDQKVSLLPSDWWVNSFPDYALLGHVHYTLHSVGESPQAEEQKDVGAWYGKLSFCTITVNSGYSKLSWGLMGIKNASHNH